MFDWIALYNEIIIVKKKQILLSGVNSFVGQSIVNKLDSFDLYRVTQNNKNLLFYNLQSGEEIHDLSFFDNLTFSIVLNMQMLITE